MGEQLKIAIAFPIANGQRNVMRQIVGKPLPALYRTDAENRPCSTCNMTLNVGPRVLESGATIYCPVCAGEVIDRAGGVDIGPPLSLGNPESRTELTPEQMLTRVIRRAKELAFCGEQADDELAVEGVLRALDRLDEIEPTPTRKREKIHERH